MDNEKVPKFLKEILEKGKGGGKSVNDVNALDKEKVLAPMKEAITTPPEDKPIYKELGKSLRKESQSGRSIGGESTTPKQPEGEHKTPIQKILKKGEQKPFRGGSGGGVEGKDLLKDKDEVVQPDDVLSKQQKQQEKAALEKIVKSPKPPNEVIQQSIKEWIKTTATSKGTQSVKSMVIKDKGEKFAENNVKPRSFKMQKR